MAIIGKLGLWAKKALENFLHQEILFLLIVIEILLIMLVIISTCETSHHTIKFQFNKEGGSK